MDKREFLKNTGAAALLLSLGIPLESCSSESIAPTNGNGTIKQPIVIDLTVNPYTVLLNDDGWLLDQTNGLLLVNVGGVINAFSNSCPHQGCTTAWSYGQSKFRCGCHGAEFSNTGNLLSGPAQQGLAKITVTREDNFITLG